MTSAETTLNSGQPHSYFWQGAFMTRRIHAWTQGGA